MFNLILQNRWSNFIIAKHVYFKNSFQRIPLIFIGTLFSQFFKGNFWQFILEIFSVKAEFLRSTFDQNFDISISQFTSKVYDQNSRRLRNETHRVSFVVVSSLNHPETRSLINRDENILQVFPPLGNCRRFSSR